MQNEFTLKLTPKAEDDLDDIFNYISTELKAENAAENLNLLSIVTSFSI
jgi:plasmid stabilization system protein ParE